MFKLTNGDLLINKIKIIFNVMRREDNPKEESGYNLIEGAAKLLSDNLIEYGFKKIRQKAPEWKKKFNKWIDKYFY